MVGIRGTSILLDGETVSDVLIGEPAAGGREFTIAVPKGDSHDWADKTVNFWGRRFRTIGLPEEGMEENIPLRWNRKIKVRLWESTGGCTVYDQDTFTRHFYSDAEHRDLRGGKISKDVLQPADDVSVLIYSCSNSDGYIPKAGDIIVDSECSFEFDCTSQQTQSESMAQFRKLFQRYAVIKTVSTEKNGLKDDIRITAR